MTSVSIDKPLAGITMVEATGAGAPTALVLAAAMCGRLASDLGADVVRFSQHRRALAPEVDGFLNNGKRRLSLAGERGVAEAAAQADCLITDTGLYDAIGQSHPCAVAIAMSIDDPLGGSEFTIEARSGLLDLVGDPARQPLRLGGHQVSYAAGVAAYLAMVEMLTGGKADGPRHRRVDLLDVAIWLNWKAIGGAMLGLPSPTRTGGDGEWSVAACSDGYVALVYRSSDWDALKAALACDRLDDPRFETEAGRRAHRPELNSILRDAVDRFDRAELRRLSLAHRLPLGPVWTSEDIRRDAHIVARDFLHERRSGEMTLVLPAAPVKWNGRTFPPVDHEQPRTASPTTSDA